MSRLILLLIFALWLVGATSPVGASWRPEVGVGVFLGGYACLVMGTALWARRLSRRVGRIDLDAAVNRFNRGLTFLRAGVPVWLALGIFGPAGWADLVQRFLDPWTTLAIPHAANDGPARLAAPGLLLGTLPSLLTWIGLWWAQFPAEQAVREQNLLGQLDEGLPVHAPPPLYDFIRANFRQQILFTLLPVALILVTRDAALCIVRIGGWRLGQMETFENWVMLPSAGLVFLLAPELLRRILNTRPLPESPLRQRLEQICARIGLRYRDILLWQTQHSVGNAAVMGLVPRWRYVLLSDLLLESLTDEQIEAVFAHEAGHITHRHMGWYVVFFTILTLGAAGPGRYVERWVGEWMGPARVAETETAGTATAKPRAAEGWRGRAQALGEAAIAGMALVWTVLLFGFLSRRLERQADVFAARMMETNWRMDRSHVGEHGAAAFASALRRVAAINNMPESARSWCHGSIATRIEYVRRLSADPNRTGQFDRIMSRLYASMVVAVVAFGALAFAAG